MTDHTPEPWRTEHKDVKAHVFAENIGMDCHVATAFGPNPARVEDIEHIAKANAARIVACVNACAGIPTEQLGDVKALVKAASAAQQYIYLAQIDARAENKGNLEMLSGKDFANLQDALRPFRED